MQEVNVIIASSSGLVGSESAKKDYSYHGIQDWGETKYFLVVVKFIDHNRSGIGRFRSCSAKEFFQKIVN